MMFRILTFFFFFLFSHFSFSQELPPISVYSSKDYNAENQNWSISQANNKNIYVANNSGLLEFDGAVWRLYPTHNETIVRSVKVIGDKIFTGFYNDFGFWKKNEKGVLKFTSLTEEVDLLPDEQFWKIEEIEGWVAFQSLQRIYLYNLHSKEYRLIDCESQIQHMYVVGNDLYYQELNKGLFKLDNGKPRLVSSQKVFVDNIIIGVYEFGQELIVVTNHEGIYSINNGVVKDWDIDINQKIKSFTIYSTTLLKKGFLVLGTISNGVLIIDENGQLVKSFNQKKGLSNNTVLSLYEDHKQNIWLGLDDGINIIDINSNFKVYKDVNGVIGTAYTSIVYNGKIYLGTNQGLFVKDNNSTQNFELIKNTQGQVWKLTIIGEELFCGHNSGTFLVSGKKATRISTVLGGWKIEAIGKDTFLQGTYSGLYVFHKKNGEWKLKNKIQGFNISSRYFEILDSNTIFVNHEYKGVYKLTVDSGLNNIQNLSILNTLPKGMHSALVKYKNNILYSFKGGVFKYNPLKDKFQKDSILSSCFSDSEFITGVLTPMDDDEKLWAFTKKNIVSIEQGDVSLRPILHKIAIPLKYRKGATGFENISRLSKDKYLLGNANGYITLNTNAISEEKNYQIKINQIKNYELGSREVDMSLTEDSTLNSDYNNFDFYYSVPVFDKTSLVEYQYILEGFSKGWSDWSLDAKVLFKNLSFGKYTFKVRARVNGRLSDNIAVYNFKIKSPWYLSLPMLFVYVVSVVLFSLFMHTLYTRRYNKQKRRLIAKKQRELELQKLENDKQLAILENEKLEADVEIKSKELAGSTMNLIKKNELLNAIKEELLKGEAKSISNVIKIIDRNLNNTDDWKLFEEAFNNADKDFVKKIKTMHPSLTSNDLRLCAYLRLNLSSKEIAPLLNISPKSVEVKRYRLRKKMSLSNEQNLSDYILDV